MEDQSNKQQNIIEILMLIFGRLIHQIKPLMRAEGLGMPEIMALWRVKKLGPCRLSDLADQINVPNSTFTGIIDRLESHGYIERRPDPYDRRATQLSLLPQAEAMLDRITKTGVDLAAAKFKSIPPERMEAIFDDLRELLSHLEPEETHA